MIRARTLIVKRSLYSRDIRCLSSARAIGAVSTLTSSESEWTTRDGYIAVAAAVGVFVLGSSFSNPGEDKNQNVSLSNPSSLVQCEVENKSGPTVRVMTRDTIAKEQSHDAKSLRAYCSAIDNDLFRDEIKETTVTQTTDSIDNAINERFLSPLPFPSVHHVNAPRRISIRHTHRNHSTDDDLGGDNEEKTDEQLLATSTGVEASTVPKTYDTNIAKNYNSNFAVNVQSKDTLAAPKGYDANFSVDANSHDTNESISSDTKANKDAVLRKIQTTRRKCQDQVYTKNMYFYKSGAIMPGNVRNKFRLFALPSSESLGREMAFLLDTELNSIDVGAYNDGETSVQIADTIRGKNVFVVCATTSASAITELLLTLSALRRGSAKRICAILPYYGYSRQDRRTGMKREPIAAADMAYLLEEMGVDSVICVDLHNALLKGFFSPVIPVDHLSPGPVAAAYFYEELFGVGDEKKAAVPKITVVAAHENQVSRANVFRNALMKLSGSNDIQVALISNTRKLSDNTMSSSAEIVGDVDGRQCIIVRYNMFNYCFCCIKL